MSELRRFIEDPGLPRQALISLVVLLTAVGTVMVFSASYYQQGVDGDGFFFLRKHLLWVCIAALTCFTICQCDYRLLARGYLFIYAAAIVLLLLVFVPGVGMRLNSSARWIRVASLQFQPSELAKLAATVFVAGFFSCDLARLKSFWRGFVPLIGALALLFLLVLVEPDFGTAMFILGLSGFLAMLSGVRRRYVLGSALVFAPVIGCYVWLRWEMISHRLLGFLEPMNVYQVRHSLYGLGSGGWFGLGLGAGRQKLDYLPMPQTDFIFSVVGEELGYIGSLGVVLLFVGLLWASVAIAARARDYFGFLLAGGIAVSLGMQAVTNIAVVTASAPTKGIPLPFLTFGGSGLLMTYVQIGLLLAVHRRSRRLASSLAPAPAGDRRGGLGATAAALGGGSDGGG